MSALHPKADLLRLPVALPLVTQLGHSRGFESNGCLRPEMVIGRGLTERLLSDQKADIRANCCGAERFLVRLCRLI